MAPRKINDFLASKVQIGNFPNDGLPLPKGLDFVGQQRKRNVIGTAPGGAKFAHHAHRSVCVSRMHEDGRGALQIRIATEPARDRVAGSFVVSGIGIVMLGMEIVIQKDRVVRTGTQKLLRFRDVVRDIEKIAFEAIREPTMASFVIVQQKDADGMSFSPDASEPELSQ